MAVAQCAPLGTQHVDFHHTRRRTKARCVEQPQRTRHFPCIAGQGSCVDAANSTSRAHSWGPPPRSHGPKRSCIRCAAGAAGAPETARSSTAQPDLVLSLPDSPHCIHVFGVEHTSAHAGIAEWVLAQRPSAVVVETAVSPEHGARPGNRISCLDRVIQGPAAFYLRMYCQVAVELREQANACAGDIAATPLWQQVRGGAYRGEQLTYIAALATETPLVFGDRPKDITYRRLYGLTSLQDLDQGFGYQAAANYLQMLGQPPPPVDAHAPHVVHQICMQEREAVMCSVAHDWMLGRAPSCQPASRLPPHTTSDPDTSAPGPASGGLHGDSPCAMPAAGGRQGGEGGGAGGGDVVLLVGRAHIAGLQELWTLGRWRQVVGADELLDSLLLTAPPLSAVPTHETGLRRGLLHAVLRMSAPAEVLADLETTLGPVPLLQQPAFQAVSEIYGSTRTMLACLPPDLLHQVCEGIPAEEGSPPSDLWSRLQPVRNMRISQGGPGYSEEMVTFLRSLNFDLD